MDECPTFPELNITEWGQVLLKQLKGKRYPLSGMFELTDRCNLDCVHCYINQPAACQSARETELSTGQVKAILDQLAAAGSLYITFTGGEVFLRPDFADIYTHARRLGLLVTVFTNATLLTPRLADLLAEIRPRGVEVTLYGATRETYEKVTSVPGSYDRCMRGISMLLERKIPLNLKSVLLRQNVHELPEMQSFALERGLNFRYDGLLWPRLDGSTIPAEYRLTMEELVDLDLNNPERKAERLKIEKDYGGVLIRSEYVYACGAGIQSFHIDSAGKISACTMARQPSYDLKEIPFNQAWESLGEIRKLKRELETRCQTCDLGGSCQQCPGWSQSVHGDNETPVDFICQLAHLRADRLKSSIM